MKTKSSSRSPRSIRSRRQATAKRNKWWRPTHSARDARSGHCQWASVLHPDFLFVAVHGCRFVSRTGNVHFDLMTTKPETIYVGKDNADAVAFARKWIARNSGRDYCTRAREKFKKAEALAKYPPGSQKFAAMLLSVEALLGSGDLDLGGVISAKTAALRDQAASDLAAAKEEHAQLLRDFSAIGQEAIDAFDQDSNDAEASALKTALDTARPYAPALSPDNPNWAI